MHDPQRSTHTAQPQAGFRAPANLNLGPGARLRPMQVHRSPLRSSRSRFAGWRSGSLGLLSWLPALLLGPAIASPLSPSALPLPAPGSGSPWHPSNWLSCTPTRCAGTRPDGTAVLLERRDSRLSPRQTVVAVLGDVSLTSTSERSPITAASLAGPVLTLPPTRSTEGTVFGAPLSIFTSPSGVVSGSYGDQPVLCAADGWGYPGNPGCF